MAVADLQQELHHVEARIHSLVKERASLQHALNTPATAPQLSPEEARAETEERRAAQKKQGNEHVYKTLQRERLGV